MKPRRPQRLSPRQALERQLGPRAEGAVAARELLVRPPEPVSVGAGNVVFIGGRLNSDAAWASGAELLAQGAPTGDPVHLVNPGGGDGAFWWTLMRLDPVTDPAAVEVALRPGSGDGDDQLDLGSLSVTPALPAGETPTERVERAMTVAGEGPLISICMATHEPPLDLFREQVRSIREQTRQGWICLISDDGSGSERRRAMRDVIGDDERFVIFEHRDRVGFYRNYERLLAAVPVEAELVALADQDDRWYPDKLATLLEGLGDRDLVYGDMRLVAGDGEVISDTYWTERRNNWTDLASLLVGNTVTGSASLFRAELLGSALPFPPPRGRSYHDHWIALTALTGRGLAFVERPLQDYVQHGGAAQGHAEANRGASYLALRAILGHAGRTAKALVGRGSAYGFAERYFGMHTRTVMWARILLIRRGRSLAPRQARTLRRVACAERSPLALLWLAGRSLRPLWGANEAFGRELLILTSVLWVRALHARSRIRTRFSSLRRSPRPRIRRPQGGGT